MYDVIIIGGGPAGYPCAIRCAQNGLKVCLVEDKDLGGVCLNRGCIPTKSLFSISCEVGASRFKSIDKSVNYRWDKILSEVRSDVVMRLRMGVGFLLKQNGIDLKQARAEITEPGAVKVGDEIIRCKNIVIASGAQPCTPEICRSDPRTLTSDGLWEMQELPSSLAVIGGGVIGCEFASIFNKFGVDVTIYEMMDNLLPETDTEISGYLGKTLSGRGVKIFTGKKIESIEEIGQERILVTVGRQASVPLAGDAEIEIERGAVKTDSRLMTSQPGIYAAGDVNGKFQYAYVATREGEVAAANIAGGKAEVSYENIPSAVFTDPEVGSCGMTEKQAKEAGIRFNVGRFPYSALGKAYTDKHTEGFAKVLADSDSGRVLGIHIVGKGATEMVSLSTLAVASQMDISRLEDMLFCHPTYSEAIMEAVEDTGNRSVHLPPKK